MNWISKRDILCNNNENNLKRKYSNINNMRIPLNINEPQNSKKINNNYKILSKIIFKCRG